MLFEGLDKAKAEEVWRPFLAEAEKPDSGVRIEAGRAVVSFPARAFWNPEFLTTKMKDHVRSDPRPGAPANNVWWASNQDELGIWWHGYESTWMPESLLREERQRIFAAALFAASRHWSVSLHFNKGLAGSPPEAIAARAGHRDESRGARVPSRSAIIAGGESARYPGVAGHSPDEAEARTDAQAIRAAMAGSASWSPTPARTSPRATTSRRAGSARSGAPATPGSGGSRRSTTRTACSSSTTASGARTGAPTG